MLKGLEALGLRFTVGMRRNRLTLKGQALCELTAQERNVQLQGLTGLDLWVYWIWLLARRKDMQEQRFLITNRRRHKNTVHHVGRRRWKIEALFKTLKSRFALGKFGQKTKQGVLRFLCLSFACFLPCHLEFITGQESGSENSEPDWGNLAKTVRHKLFGRVRIIEIEHERIEILAVLDEGRRDAA